MKKEILVIAFCLVLLLGNAIAGGGGAVCSSDDPAKIILKAYNVVDPKWGDSVIVLANATGGDITLVLVKSQNNIFVVEKWPNGMIKNEEEFQIEGNLFPETEGFVDFDERIVITYIDLSGNEKETSIRCSRGRSNYTLLSWFILFSIPSFLLGIVLIVYGWLKRKNKFRTLGIFLIGIAILFLALSLFFAVS